jgi:BMFP domain-containing protein YqiC
MAWSKVRPMLDPKLFDDIVRRLAEAVPSGMRELQQDVEKNLRAVLQASLSKLDLVTREEFDVQARVLARTREKLDKLEKILGELEAASRRDRPPEHPDAG